MRWILCAVMFLELFQHLRKGYTAEALRTLSKEFLIKKYSDLCKLRVSL